jgi:hypothetical protein
MMTNRNGRGLDQIKPVDPEDNPLGEYWTADISVWFDKLRLLGKTDCSSQEIYFKRCSEQRGCKLSLSLLFPSLEGRGSRGE